MPLVIMESPYAGDVNRNLRYARAALRDCLDRGESPLASHLLYTQPGILDDANPDERTLGIAAGIAWAKCCDRAVFYVDLGWSNGMNAARIFYEERGIPFEERSLGAKMLELAIDPTPLEADPDRIWLRWSDDGLHIRRWQRVPFAEGACYARC